MQTLICAYWASTLQVFSSPIVFATTPTSGYSPVHVFDLVAVHSTYPAQWNLLIVHVLLIEMLLCVTFGQEIALIQRSQWMACSMCLPRFVLVPLVDIVLFSVVIVRYCRLCLIEDALLPLTFILNSWYMLHRQISAILSIAGSSNLWFFCLVFCQGAPPFRGKWSWWAVWWATITCGSERTQLLVSTPLVSGWTLSLYFIIYA